MDLAATARFEMFSYWMFFRVGRGVGVIYPGLDDDSVSPACMRLCTVSTNNLFPAPGYEILVIPPTTHQTILPWAPIESGAEFSSLAYGIESLTFT